ncbi:hypothetical protein P152DRAFT_342432 [Eremomyces bilateralis CBS 781.70]|uniref:WAC domain-containing protein n=1 Tax=Eremomyces bilateralis CBS 781.70 TaxID=1392243 RepID=A0A6G1G3P7_9PEZI|nr:uncharacterized protein P152DRAFT_342432 [Eremomyces bilateralis CBS 781.70]KAF1812540.1 hypothetical protein P152DRAFT_342432 [Eremomyces bilateralis CBS 781.70]
MVQFKRKPVQYVPHPKRLKENDEVFFIQQTGEIFRDYEAYLQRRDFYLQKKFTCEITGRSGLSFFDALESEMEETRIVDDNFPEPLREPVLRRVQFSTISRIDDLVTLAYDEFKEDFFPGETVIVLLPSGDRTVGQVREKTTMSALTNPDGSVERPAQSRYFIRVLANRPDLPKETYLDGSNLTRDKKFFTKNMLRAFLKQTLSRASWVGAPWNVKPGIAREYSINIDIPPHLAQSEIQAMRFAERERKLGSKRAGIQNHITIYQGPPEDRSPDFSTHSGKSKHRSVSNPNMHPQQHFHQGHPMPHMHGQPQFVPYQAYGAPPGAMLHIPYSQFEPPSVPVQQLYGNQYAHQPIQVPIYQPESPRSPRVPTPPRNPTPPPPPIKYPIEDLDITPKEDVVARPQLKYLTTETAEMSSSDSEHEERTELQPNSVGPLLEIWNTLNVHKEVFTLDSFTIDDFLDAMDFSSDELDCELFVEIHCAVLSILVNPQGHVLAQLPQFEESSDESESESEESDEPSPEPEPVPVRTTRGSLRKQEIERLRALRTPTPDPNAPTHRAPELLENYGWIERLKARDFRAGGWEVIMIGVLWQLSLDEREKKNCEPVLRYLAPLDVEPTQETTREHYATMDINLRIQALETITMLAVRTKPIREYMEQMSEQMTEFRKQKIDCQRKRKVFMEELREVDDKRKTLQTEIVEKNLAAETNGDAKPVNGAADEEKSPPPEIKDTDSEETEDEMPTRTLRRADERKRKREEEITRKEQEKKAKADAKSSKQDTALAKLMKQIDGKRAAIKGCEDQIATIDDHLRETNIQRTKQLGRDRFWNRYYWFERNGMSFAPSDDESCPYGYKNGRLWIQGPDASELAGFIDLPPADMADYKKRIGMTVPQRRDKEEGATRLPDANHWGYLDSPTDLAALIDWLDDRGLREKTLRKELVTWRVSIAQCMTAMHAHRDAAAAKRAAASEDGATRVSTRTKTYADLGATRHRCLMWRNGAAVERLGHRHGEPGGKKIAKGKKGEVKAVGKSAKLVTRGTRSGRG